MILESIFKWIEAHPGLASWVQAVGSIAAILAAIWIASRDSRMKRNAEVESKKNALVRAEAVVKEAALRVVAVIDILEEIIPDSQMTMLSAGLNQSMQHLAEVSASEGVGSEIYTQLFLTRIAVEDVAHFVSMITPEKSWTARTRINVKKRLTQIESSHAVLVAMQ